MEKKHASVRYTEVSVGTKAFAKRNWRPFAIRIPFLTSLAVSLLICVVVLEILIRRSIPLDKSLLPHSDDLHKRMTPDSSAPITSAINPSAYLSLDSSTPTAGLSTTSYYTSGYLSLESTTSTTAAGEAIITQSPGTDTRSSQTSAGGTSALPHSSDYLNLDPSTAKDDATTAPPASPDGQSAQSTESTYLTPKTSDYLNLDTTTTESTSETQAASSSQYLELSSTTSVLPQPSATSSDYLQLSSTGSSPPIASSSAYLQLSSTTSVTVGHAAPSDYAQLSSTSTASASRSNSNSDGRYSLTGSIDKDITQQPSLTVQLTSFASVRTSNGELITSVIVSSVTKTQSSISPSESAIKDIIANARMPNLKMSGDFHKYWYFVAMYVPVIIAVVLKEAWFMSASGLKMMEPFYSMNKLGGAAVADSLTTNYLSSPISWQSIKNAVSRGNWIMITIIILNVVMGVLPSLAAESMGIIPLFKALQADGTTIRRNPAWVLKLTIVRVLQVTLSTIACFALLFAFVIKRRRSNLTANPSKIATMASLLHHPQVVEDLRNLHPDANDEDARYMLANNRYTIDYYQNAQGSMCYGLIRVGNETPQQLHTVPQEDDADYPTEGVLSPNLDQRSRHHLRRTPGQVTFDVILIVMILGLLGVIVAYYLDGSDSAFNRFFNSGQFGPRFIMSLSASFVVATFEDLEREVRIMTPYRRLASRRAKAKNTLFASVNGTAVSSLFRSIRQGDWYLAFIALTTVLGNVLIIAVTGIPFTDSVTQLSFKISSFVSMGLMALMMIAAISVFMWRRRNQRLEIMQSHGTLVRVWMLLRNPGNQLRSIFRELGDADESVLRDKLRYEGGSYWAGWITSRDGRSMWCVDRELSSDDFPFLQQSVHELRSENY